MYNTKMQREEFYAAVAVILNVENNYKTPMPYRRRWGQRLPGNGRYPGIGIIRFYSENMIHIMLPSKTSTFRSSKEALVWLTRYYVNYSEVATGSVDLLSKPSR